MGVYILNSQNKSVPALGIETIQIVKGRGATPDFITIPILARSASLLEPTGDDPTKVELLVGNRLIRGLHVRFIQNVRGVSNPQPYAEVVLADRRHYWNRTVLCMAYNIKRRVGAKAESQITSATRTSEAGTSTIDIYEYRSSTIKNGKPVTVRDAFIEQMKVLGESLGGTYILPADFGLRILAPVEFVGAGDSAIVRIMEQAPDYNMFHRDDGMIEVYKVSNVGDVAAFFDTLPLQVREESHHVVVDMKSERPKAVHVYFDVEQELLFAHDESFDENEDPLGKTTLKDYQKSVFSTDDGTFLPVLAGFVRNPIRFSRKTLGGELIAGLSVFDLAENSWIKQKEFYERIKFIRRTPVNSIGPLSLKILRKIWLRPWDMQAQYLMLNKEDDFDEQYSLIVSAAQNSFRQSFGVVKPWRDLFRAVLPYRSSLMNAFDLTRPMSPVYTDYTLWPSRRLVLAYDRTRYVRFGFQVRGFPRNPDKRIAGPGTMKVLDSDALVFQMDLTKETHGEFSRITPGLLDGAIAAKVTDLGTLRIALELGLPLKDGWGMTTIMTAVPYYRQDKGHLFKVEISPKQAETRLAQKIGRCLGPVLEVKVPYSEVTTARFQWNDVESASCVDPFTKPKVSFNETNLTNGRMINDVATAIAAKVYASSLDAVSGDIVCTPSVAPDQYRFVGNMQGMVTSISPDANFRHVFTSTVEIPIRDYETYLSDESRAQLYRIGII